MTAPAAQHAWSTHIRAVAPGAALALIVGGAALELQRLFPARWALPDVLVALIVGSIVVNSPLSKWLGLAAHDRGRNRYGAGLTFVGKAVLRASVVLMGLRIEARLFESRQLMAIALGLVTALPTTFFVTRALAIPLRVPRRLADLIASGTMICGASAVNAVAPVIGARRQEQGVALATIFLYSAVALVLFRTVAAAAGLDAHQGGIWSGLAVNDLASAVAVGAQMGPGGAEMAAVSKSARVLMLAPVLILFSLWRADRATRTDRSVGLGRTLVGHIPGFVVGFLILALVRAAGDRLFGQAGAWRATLAVDRQVVAFATVTVSAGIGLHLEIKGLLSAGARAVLLGAAACATMSGLTLALMVMASRGDRGGLVLTSAAAVGGSFALWQLVRRTRSFMVISAEVSRRHRAMTASGPILVAATASALTASGAHRHASVTGEHPAPVTSSFVRRNSIIAIKEDTMRVTRRSVRTRSGIEALVLAIALAGCSTGPDSAGTVETENSDLSLRDPFIMPPIRAQVVAQGIPGAGAITEVGTFHRGSPIHDKATLNPSIAPGMVLDPVRLLVASSSSFGATLSRPAEAPGAVLSLDVNHGLVTVAPDLATAGGQAASADGLARIYANQDAAFLNSVNNPTAATAALPSSSLPLGISINSGNGRPWIANAPTGANGAGTITVDDPSGAPLAGPPNLVAGGVFSGDATNRSSASTEGLDHGAVGTAILSKSPDGTGKAVFLAAEADGSIVQVHVLKGVDGLAPAGTFHPLNNLTVPATQSTSPDVVTRIGMVFNWVPTRVAYVSDPLGNQIVALDLSDDGTLFVAGAPRFFRSPWFNRPVDLAPAVREVSSDNFASNTTLGGGSDIYVLNRGDNSIVRINQAGQVLAARRIQAALPSFRVNGIAVSENAQTIWVTAVMAGGQGVVLQMPAFGAGFVTPSMVIHALQAGAATPSAMGADMFATELSPLQALGPLFNGRSCGDCHNAPIEGGMGATADTFVTRVGRIDNGVFDDLSGHGGPVARSHSIAGLGFFCGLPTGVPPLANVTSKRSAMTLRGTALIDFVQTSDILTAQAAEPAEVRGKLNVLPDGRPGKFGWKAQFATLIEFMGDAYTHEMGMTNPLVPDDEVTGCGANFLKPEIDALPLQAVDTFMASLDPVVPDASCTSAAGATTFAAAGCASCHTPSLPGPGRTINLYSDLLVHDMGPGLADQFVAGSASGNEWRTAPLWRASERVHFLHDGRATSVADAIAAHGGQAAAAAAAYAALDPGSQQALLAFLGCI